MEVQLRLKTIHASVVIPVIVAVQVDVHCQHIEYILCRTRSVRCAAIVCLNSRCEVMAALCTIDVLHRRHRAAFWSQLQGSPPTAKSRGLAYASVHIICKAGMVLRYCSFLNRS